MSEEDFIVGYTLFKSGGFRTKYQHFNNLETAKMFTSNVNLKDTSKIYVPLDLYNKQKEEITSLENQLDFIGEQNKYINRLEYEIKKKDAYIDELENWTKEHPSVIAMPKEIREEAEKLGHFADLVTIEEKEYISKDKIRKLLNEYEQSPLVNGPYVIKKLKELSEE